jgi:hypothetical protein
MSCCYTSEPGEFLTRHIIFRRESSDNAETCAYSEVNIQPLWSFVPLRIIGEFLISVDRFDKNLHDLMPKLPGEAFMVKMRSRLRLYDRLELRQLLSRLFLYLIELCRK